MPNLSFSWVSTCASSALRSSALEGMQPTLRQTPPQYLDSTTATLLPSWAARMAATYPPGPAPRTTTSKCGMPPSVVRGRLRAPGACPFDEPHGPDRAGDGVARLDDRRAGVR